jgi:hypothetical protein
MGVQPASSVPSKPARGASEMVTRWAALGLVVVAILAVDPAGVQPFTTLRWAMVSTLGFVTVAAACWSGAGVGHRPAALGWAVLLVCLWLSALVGDDRWIAVVGHPDRHLGAVTWTLFAGLFVAGQRLGRPEDRRLLERAVVAGAIGVGLWAVWELIDGPPIDVATTSDRLLGPFGSASMLGAACCLLLPIAAGRALDAAEHRAWRITAAVGAMGTTIAAFGSGTRAAWVGIGVGAVVAMVRHRPPLRVVGVTIAVAAIGLLVVAPRFTSVVDRDAAASSRVDEWRLGARVLVDHPVLGVGPEGYRIAAVGAVDRDYERTYGRSVTLPDRAHSAPLDVALAGGPIAALAWLGLVGFVCRRGVRSGCGIGIGLVAYAAQSLFLFPLAEVDPVWWLLAGAVVGSTSDRVEPSRSAIGRRTLSLTAAAVAVVALVAGVLDVAADRLVRQAQRSTDVDVAIDRTERAVDLRPDVITRRLTAARVRVDRGSLADLDLAEAHLVAALDRSPLDPILVEARADLLTSRAVATGDPDDAALAREAWDELVTRDPNRAAWQLGLGRAAALTGDVDAARTAWTIAADLAPRDPRPGELLAALDGAAP